jgi:ankyrin repeat protein
VEIVRELLDPGDANPDIEDNKGLTAVLYALANGHKEVASLLKTDNASSDSE